MMATVVRGHVLAATLLMLSGCTSMFTCEVQFPGYWPDPNDSTGILVSTLYMAEAVDDEGRRWLWPGNCTDFLYRADSDGKEIQAFALGYSISDIAAGAGAVWAIPVSGYALSGTIRVFRINPETATVDSEGLLPVKMDWSRVNAGRDFIWVYGRLRESIFDWSYQLVVAQIDAKSLAVIATYEVPDVIPIKSGAKIRPLFQPELLLIDEVGYLLLGVRDKETKPPMARIVKLDLGTREYSELATPLRREDVCPDREEVIVTESGKNTDLGIELGAANCI